MNAFKWTFASMVTAGLVATAASQFVDITSISAILIIGVPIGVLFGVMGASR